MLFSIVFTFYQDKFPKMICQHSNCYQMMELANNWLACEGNFEKLPKMAIENEHWFTLKLLNLQVLGYGDWALPMYTYM